MKFILALLISVSASVSFASQSKTAKKATEVLLNQASSLVVTIHDGSNKTEKKLSAVLADALVSAEGSTAQTKTYCAGNSYDGTDECTLTVISKSADGQSQTLVVSFETFRDKNGLPDALVMAPYVVLSK